MRRMHAVGGFGPNAVLVDFYALTRAVAGADVPSLTTRDGHHYPRPVVDLERDLLWYAFAAALRSSSQPLCLGAGNSTG